MSNYTKSTNFATKDALPSGNPLKIVRGTEIDTEFNNIATAVNSKADAISPTFTGTVTIPTLVATTATVADISYTSTLTGGTGVVNIGSGQIYKDASGNVGIGTSSPASILEIEGARPYLNIDNTSGTGSDFSGIAFSTAGTTRASIEYDPGNNFLRFNGFNNTERMRIDASGNVGIGSAASLAGGRTLTMTNADAGAGTWAGFVGSSNAGSVRIQANSTAAGSLGYIVSDAGMTNGLVIGAEGARPLSFQTNSLERLRIRSDGSLWTNGNTQPVFHARAWVNFDGTLSSPISPRASGNVSSVTKNGTGDYTINLLTAMPDTNYAVNITGQPTVSTAGLTRFTSATTSAFRYVSTDTSAGALDLPHCFVSFFR